MREGVHLWRRAPPPSEMENEIEIRFHFEKSSRIKKLFALRAAQFF